MKFAVRSEILTAVAINSSFICDIILCSPLKVNRRLGGCHFQHQGSRSKAKEETEMKQARQSSNDQLNCQTCFAL
jgi:hypothetical protein